MTDDIISCPECGGKEIYTGNTDYGSLATGGDYEIWVCTECSKLCYHQLPD